MRQERFEPARRGGIELEHHMQCVAFAAAHDEPQIEAGTIQPEHPGTSRTQRRPANDAGADCGDIGDARRQRSVACNAHMAG